MDLAGKVALVTGASSGIGTAMARAFAREGAAVLLADLDETRGESLAAELRAAGVGAAFRRCDVAWSADLEGAIEAAVTGFGGLHVMCNNAGISQRMPLFQDEDGDWLRVMEVDLMAVIDGTRLAVRHMAENGGGVILNTASMAGLIPVGDGAIYAAAKAGVVHFSRCLAYLANESNIRVNVLCPTFTRTPMGLEIGLDEVVRQVGGILEPEDIAEGALELIRDDTRAGAVMRLTVQRGRDYAFEARP